MTRLITTTAMDTMTFKQGSDDQILAKLSAPSLTDTADTAVQSPQQHGESAGAESVCVSCDSVPIVGGGDPNTPLRMYLALKMLRAWNHGTEGFEALTVMTVYEWIDGGMNGPIPWPNSPFFTAWATNRGWSNIYGHVGFRMLMDTKGGNA